MPRRERASCDGLDLLHSGVRVKYARAEGLRASVEVLEDIVTGSRPFAA